MFYVQVVSHPVATLILYEQQHLPNLDYNVPMFHVKFFFPLLTGGKVSFHKTACFTTKKKTRMTHHLRREIYHWNICRQKVMSNLRFRTLWYSLREHLRTHETFTVDRILRDFFAYLPPGITISSPKNHIFG